MAKKDFSSPLDGLTFEDIMRDVDPDPIFEEIPAKKRRVRLKINRDSSSNVSTNTNIDSGMLEDLLSRHGLPLDVKKQDWSDDYFFRAENLQDMLVSGTMFVDGEAHSTVRFSLYDNMQLCYSPSEVSDMSSAVFSDVIISEDILSKLPNPNDLDLNMRNYIKGVTKLFFNKNDIATSAVFDHFSIKNGQVLIYVIKEGESKPGFYRFPQTTYIFPNKDDAQQRSDKENRQYGISPTEVIVAAYSKKTKAKVPLQNKSAESRYEYDYYIKVEGKLAEDISISEKKQKEAQDDIKRANEKIREEYAAARENKCRVDDHTLISHQRTMDLADGRISEAKDKISKIKQIRKDPYVARIDCGATMQDLHTVYLGKEDIDGFVVSWRNPAYGNVYHKSGFFQGRDDIALALKRVFTIKNGQYEGFVDEICLYGQNGNEDYSGMTDAVLTKLLEDSRLDKHTHDIIKTIQSEQYDIITSDFTQNAIINGCAGSGKTMIMYHRLSYMAYNYPSFLGKQFEPDNVYIISPSKYFDLSNDELLAQLSIDSVHQSPFYDQVNNLTDKYCYAKGIIPFQGLAPYVNSSGSVDLTDDFFSTTTFNVFDANVKNVNNEEDVFHQWIISYANYLLKSQGFPEISSHFHPMTYADITAFFSTPQYYFNNCFEKKNSSKADKKYYSKTLITNIALENIYASLENNYDKTSATYQQRLKRLNKHLGLLKCSLSLKTKKDSMDVVVTDIGDFWGLFSNATIFEKMITLISVEKLLNALLAKKSDNTYLALKMLYVYFNHFNDTVSDFIPLYYLRLLAKKFGAIIEEESLIFIDEFQNYSSFEIESFKDAFLLPIFNLFGDYDQRIEDKGTDLKSKLVTLLNPNSYNLNINYRNAKQITEYINQAVHKNMQSINVDGTVIETNIDKCYYEISDRTAIVCKDVKLALLFLKRYINIAFINDVLSTKELLADKFNLMSVLDCKGLEFETVYVLDYGMTDNEKYVAYTRALDTLIVIPDDLQAIKLAEEEAERRRKEEERQRIRQEKEKKKKQKYYESILSIIKQVYETRVTEAQEKAIERKTQVCRLVNLLNIVVEEKTKKQISDERQQEIERKTQLYRLVNLLASVIDKDDKKADVLPVGEAILRNKELGCVSEISVPKKEISHFSEEIDIALLLDYEQRIREELKKIEEYRSEYQREREESRRTEEEKKEKIYLRAVSKIETGDISQLDESIFLLELLGDYKNSVELVEKAKKKILHINMEAERIAEEQRKAEEARIAEEQRKAEEACIALESWKAAKSRFDEEAKRAASRMAEEKRKAEEARIAEEKRKAEEARIAEEQRKAEEARIAEEQRRVEETRIAEEKRRAEEFRVAEERWKKLEEYQTELQRREEESKQLDLERKSKIYLLATSKIEKDDVLQLNEAIFLLETLGDYDDVIELLAKAKAKILYIHETQEARIAEERCKAEEARIAEERHRAEEARIAEERRRAEEVRIAEEQRKAEEARIAEERRKAEEARIAEEQRKEEEARAAEEQRKAEEVRIAEERRKTEEACMARYKECFELYNNSEDVVALERAITVLESIKDEKRSTRLIQLIQTKISTITIEKQRAEFRSKNMCQYCGGKFKGLFTKVCSDCDRPKDY